jgi:Pregnancy-associated plasma protein-A
MKNLIIFISLFAFSNLAIAQNDICGTKPGEKPFIFTKDQLTKINSTLAINTPYAIKIWVTVFADDNGTNRAATGEDIKRQIQNMSNQYSNQNICFVLMGITQINNSDLNDHDAGTEVAELLPYIVSGNLNIFIHASLPGLFGIAYAIPNTYLSIRRNAIAETQQISILAHEMGHCLGLYHTFEPWTNTAGVATNLENVDRNGACKNCTTGGDVLCDTPADRNDGYNPNSCTYTGTTLDPCNTSYNPLLTNIMSYYNFCSNSFTSEQGTRMRGFLLTNSTLNSFIATDNISTPSAPAFSDVYSSGNTTVVARDFIEICNNTAFTNSYIVNNTATQKIVSRKITLKPGTRLQPSTGKVQIIANPYCN